MKKFWQIVPSNDGYNYLGYINGEHILCSKSSHCLEKTLLFKTQSECQNYINTYLDPFKYWVEEVWLNEEFYGLC